MDVVVDVDADGGVGGVRATSKGGGGEYGCGECGYGADDDDDDDASVL